MNSFASKSSFRIAGLPPEETQRWQNKLNDLQSECGCAMGAVFLLLSGVVYVAYLVARPSSAPRSWWIDLGVGFLAVLFGALLGKALGIQRAQWRLKRDISRLKRRGVIVSPAGS